MFRRALACSFCRRPEREVAKLVAGPRVHICDRCAAEAIRIMNDSDHAPAPQPAEGGVSSHGLLEWLRRMWHQDTSLRAVPIERVRELLPR